MSRVSSDEIKDETIWNGYDYGVQVWVKDGIVQNCGHRSDAICCNARRYNGQEIKNINGHTEIANTGGR